MVPSKTRAKSANFILFLEVYPFYVMFSLGETHAKLRRAIEKSSISLDLDHYFSHEYTAGRCTLTQRGDVIVRMKRYPTTAIDFGTLQHEIFHAVSQVFEHIGMPHNPDTSEEAYTYLIGYITEKVYRKLKLFK